MHLVCERGPSDCGGGYTPFMAYMAIETLQPDLRLSKKAKSTSVSPSGNLTYVFTVKNIGPLASKPGSVITDVLDKVIDFVDNSSVKFFDKNKNPITPNFSVQNQGADNNETLTFTVPSIAAGNGSTANDSITIEFDVKLKDLSRTDIWGYGCNRYVRNKATLSFKADDGTDLSVGSNSTAGCDGIGSYYSTPVIDTQLETQYTQTHKISATLTDQVNAGSVNILNTLKTYLSQQLQTLNLPASDINKYTFLKEDGTTVGASEVFTQDVAIQKYTAEADFGNGCLETYNFEFLVAKVPKITSVTSNPTSTVGGSDGTALVQVSEGKPGYFCKVVDPSDDNVIYYAGYSSESDLSYSFIASGLRAGTYKIIVGDQGSKTVSSTIVITDPTPITASISGPTQVCAGSQITLTANQQGRSQSLPLDYAWYSSTDNATWTELTETSKVLTATPTNPLTYYKVYVCDGAMYDDAEYQVTALPTPDVSVLASDSGCYQFNLVNLQVTELTGLPSTEYVLTLHSKMPSSATDDRYLIPTNKYNVKKTQVVYARMSVNNLCYDVAAGQVYVKSMEQCHPIVVQEFFSPDGDGINDTWIVGGLEDYTNPEIIVYDRFGKEVFKGGKSELTTGWDGTYNGHPLPSGDYWYLMNFQEIKSKTGHFTLKRKKE
jgi:gliding motility-associated-like protein/fimbrial isopeptide formation D2 family protein